VVPRAIALFARKWQLGVSSVANAFLVGCSIAANRTRSLPMALLVYGEEKPLILANQGRWSWGKHGLFLHTLT
jgi:hypothetical protein